MPDASTTTQTSTPALDLAAIRAAFPSLDVELNGQPVVYFDNPGGTQVPQACIDAITQYLSSANANTGGAFLTSQRTDAMLDEAHAAMADFLNAADPREIVFGANMTTLTFAFSRAIGRTLQPGDEIVVTALDHDGNIAPWLALQEERGVVVRMANFDPATCTLDMDDLRGKITREDEARRGGLRLQRGRDDQRRGDGDWLGARGRGAFLHRRGAVRATRPN